MQKPDILAGECVAVTGYWTRRAIFRSRKAENSQGSNFAAPSPPRSSLNNRPIVPNATPPISRNADSTGIAKSTRLCPPDAKYKTPTPANPTPYLTTPVFTKAPCTAMIGLNNWLTNWISLPG